MKSIDNWEKIGKISAWKAPGLDAFKSKLPKSNSKCNIARLDMRISSIGPGDPWNLPVEWELFLRFGNELHSNKFVIEDEQIVGLH